MKEKSLKKLGTKEILISILGILMLLGTVFFVLEKTRHLFVIDYDMLWHIKTGDWIRANGYVPRTDVFSWHEGLNWIPHEWLYDVFLSILYGVFGLQGIALFAAIILIARVGFVTVYNVVVKKENIQGYSIFVICMLIFMGYTWAVGRPLELTTLIMLINLVVFIKKRKKIAYYITLGITGFLVSNLHGGAIWTAFVPIIILLIIDIAYYWKDRKIENKLEHKEAALTKLKALGIGIVASLINPNGIQVYNYCIKMLFTNASEATNSIAEWQPITFISTIACLIFLVIFVSFAFNEKIRFLDKEKISKLLIICFWGVGMLRYCRLTPIFSFTVLLWGYEFVREFIEYIVNSFNLYKIFNILKIISVVCGVIFIVLTMVMGVKWFTYYFSNDQETLLRKEFPYACIDYLKKNNIQDKIYNDNLLGSWLLFNDIPTFMDGRCDPFVEEFSPGNNQFIEASNANSLDDYLTIFEKYDIKYVLLENDKDTKILLESTGNWETVVIEERGMLLKRKDVISNNN